MSAARGEPMRRDDGEVPPHVSGATVDAGLAELEHESSEELFGQLPRPILMKAMMTRGTAEWCLMTVPHAARDARARACFADLPEAAVVLRELRARAARSPLLALLSAYSAEDFMNIRDTPHTHEMRVFRRVAFRSASASPCGAPPASGMSFSRARALADMVMPNSNAAHDVRDAGEFEIDAWKLLPSLRAQVGDDALNGSAQVKALLLTHVFPGALSKGRELALSTLLYNGGMGPEMPPQLLRDAYYDFRRPCSAALRAARVASRVGVEGATLTSAQVAGLGPASREALERGRRAQLLHALLHCVEARWPGGVLMLRRHFDAAACSEPLRAALDALCLALRAACELPPAAEEDEPPMPMPPLPESTCGFCGEAMGAARHLCSRCRDVRYHGAECQAAHWPEHKLGAARVASDAGGA